MLEVRLVKREHSLAYSRDEDARSDPHRLRQNPEEDVAALSTDQSE